MVGSEPRDHLLPSLGCFVGGAIRFYQSPNQCIILCRPTQSLPELLGLNPSKALVSRVVIKWRQGALLGGLGGVLCRVWRLW